MLFRGTLATLDARHWTRPCEVWENGVDVALRLDGVTKRYGSFLAVDHFSVEAPTGRILGFLGPNGAGKTSSIRMIMSIMYPDAGRIEVLGHDRALAVKDRIGYLPEERGLYRKMTVEATLRYFGKLKGMSAARIRERVPKLLADVDLTAWSKKPVESLSKGMQQKLQFISTILHEPELVILDEPFSGLDPINMDLLQKLMLDLRNQGVTVVFSTHQMENAQRLCDRLVLINRGRKLIDGSMEQIRAQFSERIVTINGEGDFAALADLPGVQSSQIVEGHARLEVGDSVDPNELAQGAMRHIRLSSFEVQRPSLHEIFVKLVHSDRGQPAGEEAAA
ncbi:MAG: ATP-binding cassette domain-containing protein [Phycisphaerales bacterium]|nr:ATP-binding cassette domain-containing protein [Phycisphaerales bacterium]